MKLFVLRLLPCNYDNHEAFGNIISQSRTATNAYKFSTKNLDDDSNLYYFGARYYDSEIGRFITKDPDGGDVTDPQSLNPYVYVRNNPVNLVDPEGRQVVEGIFVISGAAFLATAGYVTLRQWLNDPSTRAAINDFVNKAEQKAKVTIGVMIVTYDVAVRSGTKLGDWLFAKGGKQRIRDTGLTGDER